MNFSDTFTIFQTLCQYKFQNIVHFNPKLTSLYFAVFSKTGTWNHNKPKVYNSYVKTKRQRIDKTYKRKKWTSLALFMNLRAKKTE